MNTQDYFRIGSEVKYLRHDAELEVHEERGVIRSIMMDADNRLMIQVLQDGDKEKPRNVHYATINYDQSMIKNYKDVLQDIRSIADEGTEIQMETVKLYNGKVQEITNVVFGEPVALANTLPSLEDMAGC